MRSEVGLTSIGTRKGSIPKSVNPVSYTLYIVGKTDALALRVHMCSVSNNLRTSMRNTPTSQIEPHWLYSFFEHDPHVLPANG